MPLRKTASGDVNISVIIYSSALDWKAAEQYDDTLSHFCRAHGLDFLTTWRVLEAGGILHIGAPLSQRILSIREMN